MLQLRRSQRAGPQPDAPFKHHLSPPKNSYGWSAYFQILNEDQQKEIDKAKRRR
jgi:hypothetical protein